MPVPFPECYDSPAVRRAAIVKKVPGLVAISEAPEASDAENVTTRHQRGDGPATVWILCGILAIGTAARLWGIAFGLPHPMSRPDEGGIIAVAGGFRWGDFNPHTFRYPALFYLIVAGALTALPICERILHRIAPFHFAPLPGEIYATTTTNYLTARWLSATAGITSILVVFRIAARLFGRPSALAAAAFLSLSFLHVRDSHFGVTDVPMTLIVLVAFLYVVRLSESDRRTDLVMAGLTSGLATSTKYNAALVALPALFAIFAYSPATRPLGGRAARAAAFVVLMTAAFLITSPYTLLDFEHFYADFTDEARHLAQGHRVVLVSGWIHHVTTLRYGLGIPLLCVGVIGLCGVVATNVRKGLLVGLFPIAYYVAIGTGYNVFARYMLPIVPFLCLTAGYATAEGASRVASWLKRPRWASGFVVVGVVALSWPSVRSVIAFDSLMARTDSRMVARSWIEQRFPPGTTIAQIGSESGHVFLHDDSEVKYATLDLAPEGLRPDIVIVQSSPLFDEPVSSDVESILAVDYSLSFSIDAAAADPRNVYDWQDEFYLPLAGFKGVDRAGPNLKIYVRHGKAVRQGRE